jgi:hypothetical protein
VIIRTWNAFAQGDEALPADGFARSALTAALAILAINTELLQ